MTRSHWLGEPAGNSGRRQPVGSIPWVSGEPQPRAPNAARHHGGGLGSSRSSLATRGLALRALVIGVAPWLITAPAKAWTETQVRSVSAHVAVEDGGTAWVCLRLAVQVRGGWLEGLELAGLDPDLSLPEEKPPTMIPEDGSAAKITPVTAVHPGGRITLEFDQRNAPRRGDYELQVLYRTTLVQEPTPHDQHRVLTAWTLPGWRSGLDGVTIEITAPAGAEVVMDEDLAIDREVLRLETATFFRFRRAHLPRTNRWTVTISQPEQQTPASVGSSAPATGLDLADAAGAPSRPFPSTQVTPTDGASVSPWADVQPWWFAFVALLALTLGGAKHRLLARHARTVGVDLVPALPLPPRLRWLVAVIAGICAPAAATIDTSLAMVMMATTVLMALSRPRRGVRPPAPGAFRKTRRSDLRRARRAVAGERWLVPGALDIFSPGGAVLVVAAIGAVAFALPPLAPGSHLMLIWLLVPMAIGSRWEFPPSPAEQLVELHQSAPEICNQLRAAGRTNRLGLMVHETGTGRWQTVRLRVLRYVTSGPGLLRVEVAWGSRPSLGYHGRTPTILVQCRPGTAFDRRLVEMDERTSADRPNPSALPCERQVLTSQQATHVIPRHASGIGPALVAVLNELDRAHEADGNLPRSPVTLREATEHGREQVLCPRTSEPRARRAPTGYAEPPTAPGIRG